MHEVTNDGAGIDQSMIPLIKAMNKCGMKTIASCLDRNSMNRHDAGLGSQTRDDQPTTRWHTNGFVVFHVIDWPKFEQTAKCFATKWLSRTVYVGGIRVLLSLSPYYTVQGKFVWEGDLDFSVNGAETQAEVQELHYKLLGELIELFTKAEAGTLKCPVHSKNKVVVRWEHEHGPSSARIMNEAQIDPNELARVQATWTTDRKTVSKPRQVIGIYRDGHFTYYYRHMKTEDDFWEESH